MADLESDNQPALAEAEQPASNPATTEPKKRGGWRGMFGKDLMARIGSAIILIALVLLPLIFGGWSMTIFAMVAGSLMLREWNRLTTGDWKDPVSLLSTAGLLIASAVMGIQEGHEAFLVLVIAAILIWMLSEKLDRPQPWPFLGLIYVGIPVLCLIWLRNEPSGFSYVMWLIFVVVLTDVGGYFVGRSLGKHKMAPKFSPNKTIEGLVGGMVLAAIGGGLSAFYFGLPIGPVWGAAVAPLMAVLAQAGDIGESALKRKFGVKDSGQLLPGHGGALDRFDGLVLTIPTCAGILSALS